MAAASSAAAALWQAALAPGSSPWLKTFVAGAGFMSDAYDLFIIDVVKNVMSELYPQSAAQTAAVSTAALVGAVLGQLVFGALADKVGRRTIFMVTLTLVVLSSLGSATITDDGNGAIYAQLAAWRFMLGFGVGGEYPLSATITSEGAATRTRGYAVALVFAMQGVGKILAAAVNASCLSSGMSLDAAWRFALGFGSVPGLLTVYHRWKIEESHHFKAVLHADNAGARGEAAAAAAAAAEEGAAGGAKAASDEADVADGAVGAGAGAGAGSFTGVGGALSLASLSALAASAGAPAAPPTSNFQKWLVRKSDRSPLSCFAAREGVRASQAKRAAP
jgi:MFS family permease